MSAWAVPKQICISYIYRVYIYISISGSFLPQNEAESKCTANEDWSWSLQPLRQIQIACQEGLTRQTDVLTNSFVLRIVFLHFVPSELPNLRLETSKQTVCIFSKEVTWLATCIVTCRASHRWRPSLDGDFSAPCCGTAEKIWEMWKGSGKHKQSKQLLSSFWHAGWNSMKFSLLGMSYRS